MAAIRPGRPAAKKAAAPQQPEAPPPPPPAAAKGRSSMTLPAIVVAVALLGAAFMLKGGGGGGAPATDAVATPTTAITEEGEVINLDPITMNLSGGDILKVGIALQLAFNTPEAEHAVENPAAFGARALDETIVVLGGYTKAELLKAGGVADAKAKLSARVAKLYHDAVIGVYFTQLVVA